MALVLDFAPPDWTPSQRMVAMALADRIGSETWEAWASIGDIARRSGLSHRHVKRTLRTLEASGVIQRGARHRDNGSQQTNLWIWLWKTPWGVTPASRGG